MFSDDLLELFRDLLFLVLLKMTNPFGYVQNGHCQKAQANVSSGSVWTKRRNQ